MPGFAPAPELQPSRRMINTLMIGLSAVAILTLAACDGRQPLDPNDPARPECQRRTRPDGSIGCPTDAGVPSDAGAVLGADEDRFNLAEELRPPGSPQRPAPAPRA
jgi:hypothetical protein